MAEIRYRGTMDQIELIEGRLDIAARRFVEESTAMVTRYAQVNANSGAHAKGEPHIPGSGPGPNVVSGTLRRSIKPTPPIRSAEGWSGKAGPSVIYARAVELGHPNWQGVKYPYLGPAIKKWRDERTELMLALMHEALRG